MRVNADAKIYEAAQILPFCTIGKRGEPPLKVPTWGFAQNNLKNAAIIHGAVAQNRRFCARRHEQLTSAQTTRERESRRGKLALAEDAERRLARNTSPFIEVSVIKERNPNEQVASNNNASPPKCALPVMGNLYCERRNYHLHIGNGSDHWSIPELAGSMVSNRTGSPAPFDREHLGSRRGAQPVLDH